MERLICPIEGFPVEYRWERGMERSGLSSISGSVPGSESSCLTHCLTHCQLFSTTTAAVVVEKNWCSLESALGGSWNSIQWYSVTRECTCVRPPLLRNRLRSQIQQQSQLSNPPHASHVLRSLLALANSIPLRLITSR